MARNSQSGGARALNDENDGQTHQLTTDDLTRIISDGIAQAIEEHRRLGNPIATWKDGKVAWIQPEDIAPYTPPVQRLNGAQNGDAAEPFQ